MYISSLVSTVHALHRLYMAKGRVPSHSHPPRVGRKCERHRISCLSSVSRRSNQAIAESIKSRKQRGYMTALGFAYGQGMMFWVYATIFYVGAILVEDGSITFLEFFQAFFAVMLGALGIGQVRTGAAARM